MTGHNSAEWQPKPKTTQGEKKKNEEKEEEEKCCAVFGSAALDSITLLQVRQSALTGASLLESSKVAKLLGLQGDVI